MYICTQARQTGCVVNLQPSGYDEVRIFFTPPPPPLISTSCSVWGRCLWRVSAGNHRSQAHDIMSRITSTTITVVSFYKRMRESSNCSEYSVYGKKKMNKSYQDVKKHISLNTTKQRLECSIAHTQYTCAIKYMHRIQRGLCCTTHTCCRDKNKKKMAVWIYCLFCQIIVNHRLRWWPPNNQI